MQIDLPLFIDMHAHFRQGHALSVAQAHNGWAEHVMAMPNTDPPLDTVEAIQAYREELTPLVDFTPHIAAYWRSDWSLKDLRRLYHADIKHVKIYPMNQTHGSSHGVNFAKLFEMQSGLLQEAEQLGMFVHVHAEWGDDPLERERVAMTYVQTIMSTFPKLHLIVEHISCASTVATIDMLRTFCPNLAATITPQHLLCTLTELLGDRLDARLFCKPVVKRSDDRQAIRNAAFGLRDWYFLGSDSAPHDWNAKHADGCPGCFTAPILPELLATIFEQGLPGGIDWRLRLIQFAHIRPRLYFQLPSTGRRFLLDRCEPYSAPDRWEVTHDGRLNLWPLFSGPRGYQLTWRRPVEPVKEDARDEDS